MIQPVYDLLGMLFITVTVVCGVVASVVIFAEGVVAFITRGRF